MTHDRTPAIIACMRDLADKALEAHIMDDSDQIDINLQRSARAIGVACDDVAAARLYPWTGVDEMQALGLWRFLRGDGPAPATADDRAVACRVAARFAEVALALATQATGAEEAAWLWNAAGRLSGLQGAPDDVGDDEIAGMADAAYKRAVRRVSGPQVGDTIDAADVPRRTLVECPNKTFVIRLPNGKGWFLDAAGGPAHSGWPWDGGMTDTPKVRVLAMDIPAEKCFAVAGMTPAEAREWLAKRVAGEAVT